MRLRCEYVLPQRVQVLRGNVLSTFVSRVVSEPRRENDATGNGGFGKSGCWVFMEEDGMRGDRGKKGEEEAWKDGEVGKRWRGEVKNKGEWG